MLYRANGKQISVSSDVVSESPRWFLKDLGDVAQVIPISLLEFSPAIGVTS